MKENVKKVLNWQKPLHLLKADCSDYIKLTYFVSRANY